ncbi:12201_t:CDS:2 [Acaulospora morrowiae]|uniref:RNA-dependent RNA polymerase n=1 Tax=Acaulospora morrowiae TaxID=94023 RepID=A0A9N9ATV2_9GLOM|nr:12201_t:CDS:2 [Acaulospora morrowiae]
MNSSYSTFGFESSFETLVIDEFGIKSHKNHANYSQENGGDDFVDLSLKLRGGKTQDKPTIIQPSREETIQDPWVPSLCSTSPTHLSIKYEFYAKRLPFLARFEMIRLSKPFGPIGASEMIWDELVNHTDFHTFTKICRNKLEHCNIKNNIQSEMRKLIPYTGSLWKIGEQLVTSKKGSALHTIFSANVIMKSGKLYIGLNPPKAGLSKRIYRMYSSERILQVKVDMNFESLDNQQRKRLKSLLLNPLSLAGRTYEFLYAREGTLFYFATNGIDIKSISIWGAIDNLMPLERNIEMTKAKFCSRIALSFSNTTPTIVFEPHQIIYNVPDIEDGYGHCFTDGCAAISLAAMRKIADIMGCDETPYYIQGRIGGAKGIWYLDLRPRYDNELIWIEIRKSQSKYQVENLIKNDNVHHRTMEVLNVKLSLKTSAALNTQFIRVLENGGVPSTVFTELMKESMERVKCQIIGNHDPCSLRAWVMKCGNIFWRRSGSELFDNESSPSTFNNTATLTSGWCDLTYEQCIEMLDAGFTPDNCTFLAKNLKKILMIQFRVFENKYRIDVPLSRVVTCIADPTGTLLPGQIFLQLDREAGVDERTGLRFGIIEGDVILARNPCGLPSDIVKVKAVKNSCLNSYYNVVIFPAVAQKGEGSLADRLSGGDYDGDKVFVCWEPRIVSPFNNSTVLEIQSEVEKAFTKCTETMKEYLKNDGPGSRTCKVQALILDNFFNESLVPIGMYDRYHRLQSSHYGISDPKSIYLAQVYARLIDVTKQGEILNKNVQIRDDLEYGRLPVPCWMEKSNDMTQPKSRIPSKVSCRAMDELYKMVKNEIRIINSPNFYVSSSSPPHIDPHIQNYWLGHMRKAKSMNDKSFLHDLRLIADIQGYIVTGYNSGYAKALRKKIDYADLLRSPDIFNRNREKDAKNFLCQEKLVAIDLEYLEKFTNEPPVHQYKSEILRNVDRSDPDSEITMFELMLKASALYTTMCTSKPDGTCCWKLAFRALCNIKARMVQREKNGIIGGPRCVVDDVWNSLNVDKGWTNRNQG